MEKEWYKIISFNGSQANAFEELVCQVAMTEKLPNFKLFERVGTPDGGLECYWQLQDNSEWGWQAKYYTELKSAEWNNIKKSLNDAIHTHPKLAKYYICLPHNLPDGRRGKSTQKSIWENYKQNWTKELKIAGKEIDIILWNSSTLFSKLLLPGNSGTKSFFFKEIEIKERQLFLHLDAAIENLGPKYSSDLNFKLDYLPSVFDALSRNNKFKESFKKKLDVLLLKLNKVIADCAHNEATKKFIDPLRAKYNEFLNTFLNTDFSPSSRINAPELNCKIVDVGNMIVKLNDTYKEIESNYREELKRKSKSGNKEDEYNSSYNRKTRSETDEIYKFQKAADDFTDYLRGPLIRAANEGILFLSGNAGTGKSHSLADIAIERKTNNIPTIFLLGEQFTNQLPKVFIQQYLCPTHTLEDYLKALESLAKAKQTRILFIIDAINEGVGKDIWKGTIAGLVKEFSQFQWLGFAFSYRSTYKDVVLPEHFNPPQIIHHGFEGIEYEATKRFFEYYKIQQPRIPLLNPEFSNPLFLKTFCITLNKSGKTEIPEGYEGISKILEEYIKAVNTNIGIRLHYPYKKINIVSKAVEELVKYQIHTDNFIIPWDEAYKLIEPLLKTYSNQIGFLEELIKEGLLIEDFFYNRKSGKHEQHGIVFNYERFNEHLKAVYLLSKYDTVATLKKAFAAKGKLRSIFFDRHGFSGFNAGLLNAFAIIIPEKFNIEIYEFLKAKDIHAQRSIYDSFLQSIIWRKSDTLTSKSWDYIKKHLYNDENIVEFYDKILLLAANPTNYYNADFIHSLLKNKSVAERDYIWSIKIDKLWKWYDKSAIKRIIDWSWSEEEKAYTSDGSIILLGKILSWLFTNSNRYIRDKATKAFASLFINRIYLLNNFIDEFKEVNDPYVLERIMAGSFGAITHSSNLSDNIAFAQHIYDVFFDKRKPPINVLTRDYCKGVIEYVVFKGGKLQYEKKNLYPPFDYAFPDDIPPQSWIKTIEIEKKGPYTDEESGQAQIPHSVLHWDFARYILGTNHGSSIPFVSYSINAREAYHKLKKQLRGYKKQFFTIYARATTMLNGTCDLGKRLRRVFKDTELKDHLKAAEESKSFSYRFLKEKLTIKEWDLFEKSQVYIEDGFEIENHKRKRFDVEVVQRYILKKVFDLGWTKELFGIYDANTDSNYRRADKSERIGKKYQWIAYYEILALLSDNYDFLSGYSNSERPYLGTWQHNCRNIDPTVLIKYNPKDEEDDNWWSKETYTNWNEDRSLWLQRFDDMPNFQNIISVKDENKNDWYLLYDRILWRSEKQLGKETFTDTRKELWIDINAFLVEKNAKKNLLRNASENLYWLGSNSHENPHYYNIYLGELFYSSAYKEQMEEFYVKYPYSSFSLDDKRIKVIHTVEDYGFSAEYDLSEQKVSIYKPSKFLFELIDGKTGKNDACVYDKNGAIIAFDVGIFTNHTERAFLINKEVLDKVLEKNNLELVWFFCGEKEDIGPVVTYAYRMLFSGFLAFENSKFQIKYHHQLEK